MKFKLNLSSRQCFIFLFIISHSAFAKIPTFGICLEIFEKIESRPSQSSDGGGARIYGRLTLNQQQILGELRQRLAASPLAPSQRLVGVYEFIQSELLRAQSLKGDQRYQVYDELTRMWQKILLEEFLTPNESVDPQGLQFTSHGGGRSFMIPSARIPGLTPYEIVQMELIDLTSKNSRSNLANFINQDAILNNEAIARFATERQHENILKSNASQFFGMNAEQMQKAFEQLSARLDALAYSVAMDVIKQLSLVSEFEKYKAGDVLRRKSFAVQDTADIYTAWVYWSQNRSMDDKRGDGISLQMAFLAVKKSEAYRKHPLSQDIAEIHRDIKVLWFLLNPSH